MQSIIHKIKIIFVFSLLISLIISCNIKTEFENQTVLKINLIDKKSRHLRINMFDTIVVRKQEIGYLKKTFEKVGEYITDSEGSVKIEIDTSKIYDISVSGKNIYGGDIYYPVYLKSVKEVNIEVISIENSD